ncbi:hypothetical protein [Candidatus Finniella inopinata]|uniref:Uncharacterized protein n=1 Tax=Candidatus Finniella inopinata TaxID=1696036 RepID=A0A4Q7DFH5_9PROT|nr:hypothetical protein [Candidatus Finniella inopinata]RZI45531.1 hypothetical protein EQU50_06875 [Candidatus Finniella inopinata]
MLIKFFFNYLPLAAFVLGTYSASFASDVDDDAMDREQNKALVPFSFADAEREVEIMNACDNYDDPNEPQITDAQHKYLAKQMRRIDREEEAAKTPAQKAEENRIEEEREEKERKWTDEIEDGILAKIKTFRKINTTDKQKLDEILKSKEFQYWADFAEEVGNHFRAQKRIHEANYFYDLANQGVGRYTQNYAPSSQGRMCIELYNQELGTILAKRERPTTSLFQKLEKAIRAFCDAGHCNDEVADFALPGLRQQRDHIIRWHLSTPYVSANPTLQKIAYGYGFVNKILKQSASLGRLLKSTHYNGARDNGDLAKRLIDLGFYGIWQDDQHHNWVRQDGLMIRVKKWGYNDAQLTIGITVHSPLKWGKDGIPTNLAKYSDGSLIAFDEHNEVFKLAYDNGAIFVVPSRRLYEARVRWHQPRFMGDMMDLAHFELPGGWSNIINSLYHTYSPNSVLSF